MTFRRTPTAPETDADKVVQALQVLSGTVEHANQHLEMIADELSRIRDELKWLMNEKAEVFRSINRMPLDPASRTWAADLAEMNSCAPKRSKTHEPNDDSEQSEIRNAEKPTSTLSSPQAEAKDTCAKGENKATVDQSSGAEGKILTGSQDPLARPSAPVQSTPEPTGAKRKTLF